MIASDVEWTYWHSRLVGYWKSLGVNPSLLNPDTGEVYTLSNLTEEIKALAKMEGITPSQKAFDYLYRISQRKKP